MSEEIKKKISTELLAKHPHAKITISVKERKPISQKQLDKIAKIQKKLKIGKDEGAIAVDTVKRDKEPRIEFVATVEKTITAEDGEKLPHSDIYRYDEHGREIRRLQSK